jgi:hypothetical protein
MRICTSGIDPKTLSGGYTTPYNVSIDADTLLISKRTLRALGYVRQTPMISVRVANETAQVLTEIEQRFH